MAMVYFTILGFQRACHDQLNTHHRRDARKTKNRTSLEMDPSAPFAGQMLLTIPTESEFSNIEQVLEM
jgi:hypothetical protein